MSPRILLFDIETAPNLGWYFELYKEGNILDVHKHWYVLCFAYKWLGEGGIEVRALPDYPRYRRDKEDDYYLLQDLWKLLDEADVVVAHNLRFDVPKVNARLVAHGFKPPSPYKTVCTRKLARQNFRFDSNRLDALAKYLDLGAKLPTTGKDLWLSCMNGDREAWSLMKRYNAHDVELLEAVYLKLRGWGNHPNLSHITRKDACPTCQSSNYIHRGWRYLSSSKRRSLNCKDCGAYFQGSETVRIPRV